MISPMISIALCRRPWRIGNARAGRSRLSLWRMPRPTRPGWGTTDVAFFCDAYEVVPQWAKSLSWLITPITMVYGRYIDILTMVYKPTYNWGAQPCNHVKWENCGTIMGEVWDNMGWLWMIAELNLAWQGFSFLGWDNRMLMGIVMRLINQQ